MNISHFSSHSRLVQNFHDLSVHSGKTGYTWSSNVDFSSPRRTRIMVLQIAYAENSGDQQWTPIWQFLGWTSQPPSPRLTTLDILLWTEPRFVLPNIVTLSAHRFGFSALMPLPAPPPVGSQLPYCFVTLLHITHASDKRMELISKN